VDALFYRKVDSRRQVNTTASNIDVDALMAADEQPKHSHPYNTNACQHGSR
jgi:hypothetical protein